MANFAGTRVGFRFHFLPVILAASLLLVACGAGSVDTQNGGSVPTFTSTPGTSAAQGVAYTYQIATDPTMGAVTLALVSAPSGATLNGNVLTWTPSASQSRVANQFSVTATTASGNATQSWSVTPAGTVSGTWINTVWTSNGPVPMPFDFTKVSLPPSALVPQPDGTFQTVAGTGNSDGTFTIPNIPGGYYWLRPALATSYWTSTSTFDFGEDLNVQELEDTANVTTSTLNFNLSGLDPLQTKDEVAFLPFPVAPFVDTFDASSPVGATSLSEGATITSNFDISQIGMGFLLQYEPETLGALNVLTLGSEATVSNLGLTNGAVNTISATLSHAPQVSFDLNIRGSAWAPLFENAGPGTAVPLGSDLSVTALPFLNGSIMYSAMGLGLSLVFDPRPNPLELLSSVCLVSGPNSSTGFTPVLPGEPPILTDQDFGLVQYGDPFPSDWPRVFTLCQTAAVEVPLPGAPSPLTFNLVDTQITALPTSQISPLLSQVQDPMINGSSLFAANSVAATGVTLSWTAPSGTPPIGYRIATYIADTPPGGILSYVPAETFYTAKTSAMFPPLQAGKTYLFLISDILDGVANFETSPNRSALPIASTSVVSAPITVSAGP